LFDALRSIASQNAQGEFYLTDVIAIYRRRKLVVETLLIEQRPGNSRHQQPLGTGGSEQTRETEKERRTDGGRA
jgi:bifunctional N-acetylglucosamine-1-phosphate-uridyltransferase/glucosamine-1-phosphate-acetyltransferase GlmU-like protein